MKKLIVLLLIFSSLIMTGCLTRIEYVYPEYVLPPEPVRVQQSMPVTKLDYALIFNYYNNLASEWEQWAADVKETIQE